MSTDFVTQKQIQIGELLARLPIDGVCLHKIASENYVILTDGRSFLHVYQSPTGQLGFSRYGANTVGYIFGVLSVTFGTEIFSEGSPQFWGYATKEEWGIAWNKMFEEDEHRFYLELLKYLSGEECDIGSGTVGMTHAEIAKELVRADPSLLKPENESLLMERIEAIYEAKCGATVAIPENLAQLLCSSGNRRVELASRKLFGEPRDQEP